MMQPASAPPRQRSSKVLLAAAAVAGSLLALALFSFAMSHLPVLRSESQRITSIAREPDPTAGSAAQTEPFDVFAVATPARGAQRVDMIFDGTCARPDYISVRAGVPLELHFREGQAAGRITFDDLVIVPDAEEDHLLVVPALDAGIHPFRCSLGKVDGVVVAR